VDSKRCFEQAHMTCAEFGLWKQYMMLAYTSGKLFCDGRKTADRFSGESKDHIYRLRNSLINKGWLVTIKGSGRDKKTGRRTPGEFIVLSHEQWVKKHGKNECKSSLFSELEPVSPVQMADDSPVAPVQTACRTHANSPVAPARHSSKENQLQENIDTNLATTERTSLNIEESGMSSGRQRERVAEPNMPPVALVQMADPLADALAFEKFPGDHKPSWVARRALGRPLTNRESKERERRDAKRMTPEDVLAELREAQVTGTVTLLNQEKRNE
jgi:hypothetical protein